MTSRDSSVLLESDGSAAGDSASGGLSGRLSDRAKRLLVTVRATSLPGGLQPGPKTAVCAAYLAQPGGSPREAVRLAYAFVRVDLHFHTNCLR